jgi:hypothetical protein
MQERAEMKGNAEVVWRRFPHRRSARALLFLLLGLPPLAGAQDAAPAAPKGISAREPKESPRLMEWKEGAELHIRVPVATEKHEVMTTVAFPEGGIQAAVTGWGTNSITAIQKGGFLFLKLSKPSEGQLNVIGESGIHYLLYLEGVKPDGPEGYDSYVKITRPKSGPASPSTDRPPKPGDRPRPSGALQLMREMRLGNHPDGAEIVRAKGEVLYAGQELQIALLFVYNSAPYVGRVYELRNLSLRKIALDASRFRAAGEILILSGLRENVIPASGSTRLYTIFWKA